jgi:hypothetical protein
MQSPAVCGQDSALGRRGAGAVVCGSGQAHPRTSVEKADIITESPLDLQT